MIRVRTLKANCGAQVPSSRLNAQRSSAPSFPLLSNPLSSLLRRMPGLSKSHDSAPAQEEIIWATASCQSGLFKLCNGLYERNFQKFEITIESRVNLLINISESQWDQLNLKSELKENEKDVIY